MATRKAPKKAAKATSKKTPVKSKTSVRTVPVKKAVRKLSVPLKPLRKKVKSIYIGSSFFFPPQAGAYVENFQGGRVAASGILQAPILLPVGSAMKSVTVYYKNNTQEEILVLILKYHTEHHAYSGEVEVSLDNCPPGTRPPDDFLEKFIDHFDAGGKILDKYFYLIQFVGLYENGSEVRALRGIRINYTEPS